MKTSNLLFQRSIDIYNKNKVLVKKDEKLYLYKYDKTVFNVIDSINGNGIIDNIFFIGLNLSMMN